MEIVERSMILTFDELRILLYSQGFRRCEGVYMPEKEFSQRDIIKALGKLTECGLLSVEKSTPQTEALPLVFDEEGMGTGAAAEEPDEEFYIRKDLLDIICVIGDHRDTEVITTDEGRRLFCYYAEGCVVTSMRCEGRKDAVRLTRYTAEEFESLRHDGRESA